MKTTTNYHQCKKYLKNTSKDIKVLFPNDKPKQRTILNDTADYLCKSHNLTDYARNLLANYTCTLHPKKNR